MPARQPASKFFPFRYGSPGMVFDQPEIDGDDPAADPQGRNERVGGSFVDTQITNAQLDTLAAAPIQLVTAPGALRAIVVDSVHMFLDVTAAKDDAAGDGNLNLRYVAGADAGAGFNIEADGFIDAVADAARFFPHAHDYVAGAAIVVTPVVNVGIELDNDAGEHSGGNATLSVRVYYHIVDMVAFT